MNEADVDPDPLAQLSDWLEAARGAGETMPEAMALSTATIDGRPSSRMVLLRGLDQRGLVFYTDRESDKGRDLAANPYAAILFHWYLPRHRQVRLSGAVEEVDDDRSDDYWRSRPLGSRLSAIVSHQSEVIPGRALLEERRAELADRIDDASGAPRPQRWGGYCVRPDVVELWEEGADRLHDRLRYRSERGGWTIDRLSP